MSSAEADRELIHIDGLVKRYGPVVALSGISLRVQKGEFLALLGPSGCGKTTLLRSIAGFIEPTEGEIWIDGRPMSGEPPNKRPVNTVFQNYALFPHYTVTENIAFGPRRLGVDRQTIPGLVQQALAMVGMESLGERYPGQLSGGQQQRVALARAIINKPKVLLLDEPLGALDLKLRKRMQIELKRLHEKLGITFIYVTHDQEEALVMADRIAVMRAGEIAQLGNGEEIYRTPNSRYVADFIGEANLLACKVDAAGDLHLAEDGVALPYRSEEAGATDVTLLVRPECISLGIGKPAPSDVTLDLLVRDRVFVGNTVKVYARTPGGVELMLQPRAADEAQSLSAGAKISVHWRRGDACILTK